MSDPSVIGDRYLVDTLISHGMMGPLYKGWDKETEQAVAIKALRPELLEEHPTLLERFMREGEALRQLDHPNIVHWLDVIQQDGAHYLVMAFVEGGSLADQIKSQGQLPVSQVVEIGIDLADALTRAHRLGIVHRDLKPHNVLLAEDGKPLLSDFGVAHYVERTTLSRPGGFAGTLAYIPPESFLGLEVDERTDIWAFGVMLYEMLTGVKPFESDSTAALINLILHEQPLPLDQVRDDVPADLAQLIQAMLEKEPAARIQSIRFVGAALEAISKGKQVDLPLSGQPAIQSSLPVRPTPFIGRQLEISQIIARVSSPACRLLTLTGPGGVGKSRLAIQAAGRLASTYPGGIFFVELAPIMAPDLVSGRIARSLGLKEGPARSPVDSIVDHLRDRRCLLILDNFEQVIDAAPVVSQLLAALPGLDILATSREMLHIYGEQEFPVAPLPVPRHSDSPKTLAQFESVALFVRHAQLSSPNFRLTEENARDVAAICIHLDGLPLAIELAAARTKTFPPAYLLAMITRSLDAVSGGSRDLDRRHQALRQTIDWSYALLDEGEKRLFGRLAVFHGGRSLEAMEQVCQPELEFSVQAGVESLVNKSLLRRVDEQPGYPRFFFLETIHQFARDCLRDQGEESLMKRRHAGFFASLAEDAEPELRGPDQERWSTLLRTEYDNIRAALTWSFGDGEIETGLRLAGALAEFWYYEGPLSEGENWLRRALELMEKEAVAPTFRAKVLNGAGMLAFAVGNHARGRKWNEEALAIAREAGDRVTTGWALFWLSAQATMNPETYQDGIDRIEEALTLFEEAGDQAGLAWGYNQLGEVNRLLGDLEKARAAYEASLAICQETGNKRREAIALINLSYVAQGLGQYSEAEQFCLAGLFLLRELNLEYHSAIALSMLVGPLAAMGKAQRAATILGAAEAIFERMAVTLQPADRVEIDAYTAQTREQLAEDQFEAACQFGREMSLEQALDYAFARDGKV